MHSRHCHFSFLLPGLLALCLTACATTGTQNAPVNAAPTTAQFRQSATIQLALEYQGTTKNILTRGLHLLGTSGRCHAWYRVSVVMAQPAKLAIEPGTRLWLSYPCGQDDSYQHEGKQVDWIQQSTLTSALHAWLHTDDLESEGHGIWSIPNPHGWFAPTEDS